MKKLLVLGATPFQIPIVLKAQKRGHHVTTMDNILSSPGHKLADAYANVSTIDKDNVLKYAREHSINGIITGGSDVSVPTIGFVCDALNLTGITHKQGLTLSRKDLFRDFQKNAKLSSPEFYVWESLQEALAVAKQLNGKYIIKPVDRAGSRGIRAIDFDAANALHTFKNAFEGAFAESLMKRVILEKFIDGTDISGDIFLHEGKCILFVPTNKYLTPSPYYATIGHTIPSRLNAIQQDAICHTVTETLLAMDIKNGPANFDVIIDNKERVTIIEMSPRYGGNGIPGIIEKGTGFDEIDAAISFALGEPLSFQAFPDSAQFTPTGIRTLKSPANGILKSMAPQDTLHEHYEESLCDLVYDFEMNTHVTKFTQENYRIGHIIAQADSLEKLDHLLDDIEAGVNVIVKPER